MRISKSRINNISQYATLFREGSSVYIVRCLEEIDPKILRQIGFGQKISIGDAVTPKGIGPVSKFNVREWTMCIKSASEKKPAMGRRWIRLRSPTESPIENGC